MRKIIAADSGLSHPDSGNADQPTDTSASCVATLRNDPRFLNLRAYPWILVGTYNKQSSYTRPPFYDLHFRFKHALQHSNRLIVAGYGWGDDGINAHIYDWMESNNDSNIVNIDPHFDRTEQRAKSEAAIAFRYWKTGNRLQVIEKGIQEVSWAEIR